MSSNTDVGYSADDLAWGKVYRDEICSGCGDSECKEQYDGTPSSMNCFKFNSQHQTGYKKGVVEVRFQSIDNLEGSIMEINSNEVQANEVVAEQQGFWARNGKKIAVAGLTMAAGILAYKAGHRKGSNSCAVPDQSATQMDQQ